MSQVVLGTNEKPMVTQVELSRATVERVGRDGERSHVIRLSLPDKQLLVAAENEKEEQVRPQISTKQQPHLQHIYLHCQNLSNSSHQQQSKQHKPTLI